MKKLKAILIVITLLTGIIGAAVTGRNSKNTEELGSRGNMADSGKKVELASVEKKATPVPTATEMPLPTPEPSVTKPAESEFIISDKSAIVADENKPGKEKTEDILDFTKISIPEVEISKDNDKEDPGLAKIKSETQSVTIQEMIENLTTPTPRPTSTSTPVPGGNSEETVYVKEKQEVRYTKAGLDISRYQGKIDWQKVADSGVEFVIIQCGYRGWETGKLVEDNMARKNIEGALSVGIDVGLYFFSQAITETEAAEEAKFCISIAENYNITYPIFMDLEEVYANYGTRPQWRAHNLPHDKMNKIGRAFMDCVKYYGYTPGLYGNKNAFIVEWDMDLFTDCCIWLAHYVKQTSYTGHYDIWQYSDNGRVDGINAAVDLNVQYCVKYEEVETNVTVTPTAGPSPEVTPPEGGTEDVTPTPDITPAATEFREVDDVVVVMVSEGHLNLRTSPDSSVSDNIAALASKGEEIHRSGVSAEWSRLDYNDQVLYAKNDYLISKDDPTDPLEGLVDSPTPTEEASVTPEQNNEEVPEV